jgi:hypothetical protein
VVISFHHEACWSLKRPSTCFFKERLDVAGPGLKNFWILTVWFGQFGAAVENVQIAMICEKAVPLFAGSLAHQTELDHVLQGFRNGRCGERGARLSQE